MSKTVAIVGRPNVGKSRLFNALLKKRVAIVHDQPGVTRDPNAAELSAGLTLVDTGGWGLSQIKNISRQSNELAEAVENQVEIAIQAAEEILFVVDGRTGLTSLDDQIARKLRAYRDKVTLIINKIDEEKTEFDEGEFLKLGFPRWQVVSAEHGRGIEGVRNTLLKLAPAAAPETEAPIKRPALAIIGRPNVGKSSLMNALLKQNRVIVSPISGTTRDPVTVDLDYKGKGNKVYQFTLIDTAGLRHRTKVSSSVEVFSQMRARDVLEKTNVAVLIVDALDGITAQDKQLAGDIQKAGKPIVIVVNKWDMAAVQFAGGNKIDGYETLQEFEADCRRNIEEALFFTAQAPIVFISAKEDMNLEKVLKEAQAIEAKQDSTFSTPEVNKTLEKLIRKNAPRNATGKVFRVYYATQTGTRPYYFKLFCNQVEGVNDSFKRYLARGFSEQFDVGGCPIFFTFVSKPKREFKMGSLKHNLNRKRKGLR
jgi:GTP-binding protein